MSIGDEIKSMFWYCLRAAFFSYGATAHRAGVGTIRNGKCPTLRFNLTRRSDSKGDNPNPPPAHSYFATRTRTLPICAGFAPVPQYDE